MKKAAGECGSRQIKESDRGERERLCPGGGLRHRGAGNQAVRNCGSGGVASHDESYAG